MFKKALVIEDLESTNHGLSDVLKNKLQIQKVEQAYYCDDAFLKILKAKKDKKAYDLLITDLSFNKDYREDKIASGQALIEKVKAKTPEVKVIVYSIEHRPDKIKQLFEQYDVNGFVCKGRKGLNELEKAINQVITGANYISKEIETKLRSATIYELDDFDTILLKELSEGQTQEQIALQLKDKNIKPNSISSIEKRINRLKIQFRANNSIQLIAIVKDLGLI